MLLFEDSPTDAELIEGLLGHRDDVRFDLTVAATLADGLSWLSRHTADVILLDLTLPDSVGLETFRAVRNRAPTVPVVVMTGLAETLLFAVERARRAERQTLRDPLTGLATAPLLGERVAEALLRTERDKRYVALLLLTLGDFSNVDRRFGPLAGDELLFGVSERLCEVFPPPAALARVGVDEFAVLLEGLARPSNAERAAHRLLGALAPEFKLGVDRFRATAHIGIALGRSTADGPGLVDQARTAMVAQRRTGEQGIRME